jgi:DNA repair protein RecO (recombination protein O)
VSARLKLAAVVLRAVDYGESDRVVLLFSRERGKVSAFARGARASRRRFGGALQPFTLLSAELRERPGADLLGLESVAVERAFGGIRGDLARIACAGYAAELSRELVRDHEPHRDLFELLVAYLSALDAGPARPAALRAFELGALRAAGFMPRLDACARCGAGLPPGAVRFDAEPGGALCPDCAARAGPGSVPLSPATLRALRTLQEGGLAAAEAETLAPPAGREAREVLTRFVEHLLGKRLRSRVFLDEMRSMLAE